jgi:ankyrin repeat protein
MADLNNQLIDAASDGDLHRVKLLVAQGADPAYRGEGGWNAIMWASSKNRLTVVEYLLTLPGKHPANVNVYGVTALICAVYIGSYEMTDLLLLDGRCDPTMATIINNDDCTAIKYAVRDNHVRIVELLLSDMRVVKALRKEDGVPPAVIKRAIARNAWKRRKAIVCARVLYWESLGFK